MRVTDRFEPANVERHRERCGSGLRGPGERTRFLDVAITDAVWQRLHEPIQPLRDGFDHRRLAGHDNVDRVPAEEGHANFLQPGDDFAQLGLFQSSDPADLVQHSDPLQPVVDGTFGAQL